MQKNRYTLYGEGTFSKSERQKRETGREKYAKWRNEVYTHLLCKYCIIFYTAMKKSTKTNVLHVV